MAFDLFGFQPNSRRLRFELPAVRRLVRLITGRVEAAPSPALPPVARPTEADTGVGVADTSCAGATETLWRVQHGRRAVWRDLQDMDEQDPIISKALDVIADCVTGYEDVAVDGFEWELRASNPGALRVLDDA